MKMIGREGWLCLSPNTRTRTIALDFKRAHVEKVLTNVCTMASVATGCC